MHFLILGEMNIYYGEPHRTSYSFSCSKPFLNNVEAKYVLGIL